MSSRHQAREVALQILYRHDLELQSSNGNNASAKTVRITSDLELIHDLKQHFDHFRVAPELREFAGQLVSGTLLNVGTLDQLLEKHTANWKLPRMAVVDRCLLRLGAYELTHFPETAPSVVIDEAVELAKQFGTAETPAFVNGVLDAIRKSRSENA